MKLIILRNSYLSNFSSLCIMQECWTTHTIGAMFAVGNVNGSCQDIYNVILLCHNYV